MTSSRAGTADVADVAENPDLLAPLFLPHLAEPMRSRLASGPDLEGLLSEILAAARSAWPDVFLSAGRFLRWLAARVPADGDALRGLRELNAVDLYVACACADGDPRALAAIEERCFLDLQIALRQFRLGEMQIEEIEQRLRYELFVPVPGSAPRIAAYSGRGQLRRWLRIVGVRIARRAARRARAEVPIDEQLSAVLPSPTDDPELAHMKRRYGEAFRAAFADAMRALPVEDRMLLRQHILEGRGIDELGALHGVHRATAARWLSAARESIASMTRSSLMERLRIAHAECDSLMRLIRSQVDVPIHPFLIGSLEA